jgi:NRPS condensation-like uncharacterized protein
MKGRFNTFQRTILLWNDIHPYNAVNVVRIPHHLDMARLKDNIERHLEYSGLSGLILDRDRKRFEYYRDRKDIEIKTIETDDDTSSALSREIQRQINTPFNKDGRIKPFRFFLLREEDSFYLGLVYFHLISADDSIIFLLKNIVNSYAGYLNPCLNMPLELYPRRYRHLLPFTIKTVLGWIFTFPAYIATMRKSFRPKYSDIKDHNLGFHYFRIESQQFLFLVKTARKWGVTLNDMFLAILLKILSPRTEKRSRSRRRRNVSLASIVNIRKDLSIDNPALFGIFLGYFSVSHSMPDGIQLEKLAKDIHGQTDKIKKHKLYLRAIFELWAALILISSFFKKRQNRFYPKYYPLLGSLTNINLNVLWKESDGRISDYIRAVSTGPVSPVVFSFTTVNDIINVGVSFRKTVFSDTDIKNLISDFLRYIDTLRGINE